MTSSGESVVERFDARPWSDEQMQALFSEGFPAFITADQEVKKFIGRVRDWFANLNIVLVVDDGTPVATAWGVPVRWSGETSDLPAGYTDALRCAVELHEAGGVPNTMVICGAVVHPDHKRTGIAADLIRALCDVADLEGWSYVIAPIRPTLKHRYPLISISEYAAWTREDGEPFDPWLRLHARLGGHVVAVAPTSQTMTGSVREWEAWAEMRLPGSGDYVIPGGLSPLQIDRENDEGIYIEPNIWIQHR